MRDSKKIKAKHYFELDNRQMIFVFAGFIVVCLFVFTAGVMIGSKMTAEKEVSIKQENKYRAKIKAPSLLETKEEKKVKAEKISIPAPTATPAPAPAKTIEDILERELSAPLEKEKKTEQVAAPVIPADKPLISAKKEAFFVQVASFQKSEDADRQASILKSRGYKVVIIKADLAGKGTWYRVRLGPYEGTTEAKAAALKYEKNEKGTAFVTKGLI